MSLALPARYRTKYKQHIGGSKPYTELTLDPPPHPPGSHCAKVPQCPAVRHRDAAPPVRGPEIPTAQSPIHTSQRVQLGSILIGQQRHMDGTDQSDSI